MACVLPSLPPPASVASRLAWLPPLLIAAAALWVGAAYTAAVVGDDAPLRSVSVPQRTVAVAVFVPLYFLFWWSFVAVVRVSPGSPPHHNTIRDSDPSSPTSPTAIALFPLATRRPERDDGNRNVVLDVNLDSSASSTNNDDDHTAIPTSLLAQLGVVVLLRPPPQNPDSSSVHTLSQPLSRWSAIADAAARRALATVWRRPLLRALHSPRTRSRTQTRTVDHDPAALEAGTGALLPHSNSNLYDNLPNATVSDDTIAAACAIDIAPETTTNNNSSSSSTSDNGTVRPLDFAARFRNAAPNVAQDNFRRLLLHDMDAMFLTSPIESKRGEAARVCRKCNVFKPDRCHHCSSCGSCVLKMDHHCPWVNNCVGFRNYKMFLLMLFYASVASFHVFFSISPVVFGYVETVEGIPYDLPENLELSILSLIFVTATFAICIMCFLMVHLRYVFVNSSTLESMELGTKIRRDAVVQALQTSDEIRQSLLEEDTESSRKQEHVGQLASSGTNGPNLDDGSINMVRRYNNSNIVKHDSDSDDNLQQNLVSTKWVNMYHCGIKYNFYQVFGTRKREWLLPTIPIDIGDGTMFPVSRKRLKTLLFKHCRK